MTDFTKFLLKAFLRKALTVLGTFLIARGVLTDAEAGGMLSQYLDEILGALLLAASSAWTWGYQKYVRRKVVLALSLPPGAGTEKLAEVMGEKG